MAIRGRERALEARGGEARRPIHIASIVVRRIRLKPRRVRIIRAVGAISVVRATVRLRLWCVRAV